MKISVISSIIALTTVYLPLASPLQAENLSHLNQLLGTKSCQECDLSNSGLINANLVGATLQNANLANANLSQANLAGANLTGVNLTGASLYGANLTGANLTGANLTGTDLRNAYLMNATLKEVDLNTANLNGVKGISEQVATPEQFHRWGVKEADRGNYRAAIAHYNRAISLDEEFAPAYLGLGVVYYRTDFKEKSLENTRTALALFKTQKNELGEATSQELIHNMELASQIEATLAEKDKNASNFGKFMGGIGSLLLQLML
jgi:uncharacterized protein YjbI with pentapeptide repeats